MPDARTITERLRALIPKVALPRGRGAVRRGVTIVAGLVALVAVSVLVGRITGQQEPAAVEQPAQAASAQDETAGAHDHGEVTENPWLQVPEDIESWSKEAAFTDPDGNTFTVHVELDAPSTAGMDICSMGPMAAEYNRTVILSVRNDGDKPATGPRVGVTDKRIGFPHAEGMGCSWVYPSEVDGQYDPGEAKTFRGLLRAEPVDGGEQDAVLVLRGENKELIRIPADAFADS